MIPTAHLLDCRFASIEEACTERFARLGSEMAALNVQFDLPDHADLNRSHYPWAAGIFPGSEIYGSRLWEYPFAILAADLTPGMTCADVGCGRTPFTVYLAQQPNIHVTGFDPDFFSEGERHSTFGVSSDFKRSTGLDIRTCSMTHLDAPDNHFDRVFCLSVIEHLEAPVARAGMREMARVLKPGGRLIVTVDVAIHDTLSPVDPMALIWESGLLIAGNVNLNWPTKRFGIGYHGGRPADVFGLVLEKSDAVVDAAYAEPGATVSSLDLGAIPGVRQAPLIDPQPVAWPRRLQQAWNYFLRGNRPNSQEGKAP